MRTILSVDPSFSATGWAVLLNSSQKRNNCVYQLVDYGWIKTIKHKKMSVGVDDMNRARQIATELLFQIRTHNVTEIYSEIPLGSQSANAAKALGIAKGIVATITCVDKFDSFLWMNPFQIKATLCGNKNAEKEEIIKVVECAFPSLRRDSRRKKRTGKFSLFHEAVCDAIAVALAIKKSNARYDSQ